MITFEEARDIVRAKREPEYPPVAGFYIKADGWENDEVWVIGEQVTDPDYAFAGDGPLKTVNKLTGEYTETTGWYKDIALPNLTRVVGE